MEELKMSVENFYKKEWDFPLVGPFVYQKEQYTHVYYHAFLVIATVFLDIKFPVIF